MSFLGADENITAWVVPGGTGFAAFAGFTGCGFCGNDLGRVDAERAGTTGPGDGVATSRSPGQGGGSATAGLRCAGAAGLYL